MQDEEIDMNIREAANQHHPPYDDKAWEKMNRLLDTQLPQKNDRRKWFVFLLLFLLMDSVIFLAIVKPWKNDSDTTAKTTAKKNEPSATAAPNTVVVDEVKDKDQLTPVTANNPTVTGKESAVIDNPVPSTSTVKLATNTATSTRGNEVLTGKTNDLGNAPKQSVFKNKSKTTATITNPGTSIDDLPAKNKKENKDYADIATIFSDENKTNELTAKKTTDPAGNNTAISVLSKPDSSNNKKIIPVEKTNKEQATAVKNEKKKTPGKFGNNFGLTVSVGGDMSFVSLNKPGKTSIQYGAGLSYTIAKRFTVRSGFYMGNKVYSATPEQYNNVIYPNLYEINANCKVYEIPLSVSYNFGQRKNHNWFGSAGISSLLMKKEEYEYEYKNAAGQYYTYNQSVSNENKHYFSVLTLSAGYQYNLNNRFSLLAEPYYKLPLHGVGYGKIKLQSAGVLLSVSIKPFAKRK